VKVLGLDISTSAGWALATESQLVDFGHIELEKNVYAYGNGQYPWNYDQASEAMSVRLWELALRTEPDIIIIEETNLGKSRYAQKILEFTHKSLLARLRDWKGTVIYVSSSSWRQALGLTMTKEDKKNNAKLSRAKKAAATFGVKLDKKALGIRGKVNKKHIALRYVNENYGLKLKVKDNDAADAICLTAAYFKGALPCDGVM
jgi:hypothetical protein